MFLRSFYVYDTKTILSNYCEFPLKFICEIIQFLCFCFNILKVIFNLCYMFFLF